MHQMIDNNKDKIQGMGTEKDIIVAVELGSSAIRAVAGRRELDGTMHVLAVAQETDACAIRRGVVDNIDRTAQALQNVLRKLSEHLDMQVTQVYVGLGGQSLRTAVNPVVYPLAQKAIVTDSVIQRIDDMNRAQQYPNMEILEAVPQEYSTDSRSGITTPVGMEAEILRAKFVNVLSNVRLMDRIRQSFERAGIRIAEDELLISPLCLSRHLLTESERRAGCALVDIGAETTTVAIYTRDTLRHLVVIPLGGNNATADIVLSGADADEAEELKRSYGTAYCPDPKEGGDFSDAMLSLSYERSISKSSLMGIVEARYQEIIANVWEHIRPYCTNQLSSIVFTGGGSHISDLTSAFTRFTNTPKLVRVHKGIPAGVSFASDCGVVNKDTLGTLLSLLLSGKEACVTEKTKIETNTLFPDEETDQTDDADSKADDSLSHTHTIDDESSATDSSSDEGQEGSAKKKKSIADRVRRAFGVFKGMLEEEEENGRDDR